jgi:hypothetical protein
MPGGDLTLGRGGARMRCMTEPYIPTEYDIKWAAEVVRIMKEGATIATSSRITYRISRAGRTLTLQNPAALENPDSYTDHLRTVEVFKRVGYEVKIGNGASSGS